MSLTCTKVSDNFGKNYEYTGFDGSAVWSELHRLMQDKKKCGVKIADLRV